MLPRETSTVTLPVLARVLGVSRGHIYELARSGQLPVPIIRLGRRLVVSRNAVEALLGARQEIGAPEKQQVERLLEGQSQGKRAN